MELPGAIANPVHGARNALGKWPVWLLIGGAGLGVILLLRYLNGQNSAAATTQQPATLVPSVATVPSDSSGSAVSGSGLSASDLGGLLSDVSAAQSQTFADTTAAMQTAYQQANQQALAQVQNDQANAIAQYQMYGNELQTERASYVNLLGASTGAASSIADTLATVESKVLNQPPPTPQVVTQTVTVPASLPTMQQIQQNAQGLGIPIYDIEGYVGVNGALPSSIPALQGYLNQAGLRNPSTGALK